MMERGKFGVVTFHSTSHAIRSENICLKAGIAVKMIPTPRRLSSDCGISLRCAPVDLPAVLSLLETQKVEINQTAVID